MLFLFKRDLLCSALIVVAAVFNGCGSQRMTSSDGAVREKAEVRSSIRQLLTELEKGKYRLACEEFSDRSRLAMAFASGFDGHQSDSSCSDPFIITGVLDGLGLTSGSTRLRAKAEAAGLAQSVELPKNTIRDLYKGIGFSDLSALNGMQLKGNTAIDQGLMIALRENGHWRVEAVRAKTTYSEARTLTLQRCKGTLSERYQRLCKLMEPVLAGEVLTGRRHREFDRLFPAMFVLPNDVLHIFQRAQVAR